MILSDREIAAALDHGHIRIEPRPDRALWTSTAIDLTLDAVLLEWTPQAAAATPRLRPHRQTFNLRAMLDDPTLSRRISIDPEAGHELVPGQFVLGYTRERIHLPHRSRIAARVEGKSSLARLGVGVHVTAPTIHAGFGHRDDAPEQEMGSPIQLEIFHLGKIPVVLDIGQAICQLILEEVREVPDRGYTGRFGDQTPFAMPPLAGPPLQEAPKRRRRRGGS